MASPTIEHAPAHENMNMRTYLSSKSSSSSRTVTSEVPMGEGAEGIEAGDGAAYRVYRRRWFGLAQLVLLNIIVSWDWLSFASVSSTSASFFNVDENAINWLSIAFLFSFCVATPFVILSLNHGPKRAIVIASLLILIGNWIRYGGTRVGEGAARFGSVMFGQVLIGLAQPFVLAAPTRYSDLWFTDRGRTSATAVASLANPLGAALGQLICPFWAESPSEIPQMILYVSLLSTVASIPSLFITSAPPTPPCPSSRIPKPPLRSTLRRLASNKAFYFLLIPFGVYVGLFNAISSLLNQILSPYGLTEEEAGICGAVLIVVGLVTSAIISPLIDRNKRYLLAIKIFVPILAASYVAFIWAPQTRTLPAPYIIAAFIGASSFALVPVTLELLVEITFPLSPESPSTLCWAAGQFLGAIFIIAMGYMKSSVDGVEDSMRNALIFQALLALAVVPFVLLLGSRRFGLEIVLGRLQADGKSANPNSANPHRLPRFLNFVRN